jgi:RimJ/RimL family protein N-acetyltransferase
MSLPVAVDTPRLRLRPPTRADADAVFQRYASDAEVTRYLSWPRHLTVADTLAFIDASEREWSASGAGPYLAFGRDGGLVGSTGIHLETPYRAFTGYVLARDGWGRGLATELARCMAELAFELPGLSRLYAVCHVEHDASARVLEKAGFEREGVLRRFAVFPNLGSADPADVILYARVR